MHSGVLSDLYVLCSELVWTVMHSSQEVASSQYEVF